MRQIEYTIVQWLVRDYLAIGSESRLSFIDKGRQFTQVQKPTIPPSGYMCILT